MLNLEEVAGLASELGTADGLRRVKLEIDLLSERFEEKRTLPRRGSGVLVPLAEVRKPMPDGLSSSGVPAIISRPGKATSRGKRFLK